jgi:hypothetical protein
MQNGCIRPFNSVSASNTQTSVLVRFCQRDLDYTGALGDSTAGVASWYTNEPAYGYLSEIQVNDVTTTIDPRSASQVLVATGSSASTVVVYLPFFIGSAFQVGMKGKQVTIVHTSGDDALTVAFNSNQPLLDGDTSVTTLSLPDIGDSVTIRFGTITGGTERWFIVGSNGL